MLRLLSRRRCLSCGDELPPPREYPMRVCAACILAPTRAPGPQQPTRLAGSRPEPGWQDEDDDCA